MSLLGNSSSFDPLIPVYPHRPTLKRARTPYHPSDDPKRRRTSPTGAFSRLSLSPTLSHPPPPDHLAQPVGPSASSLTLHRKHSSLARLDSWHTPSYKDPRMRIGYSPYEPEPNPMIIEELSHSTHSLTPSPEPTQLDPAHEILELDREIVRQLSAPDQQLYHPQSISFFNPHRFISSHPDQAPNDQQLVLYRRPLWPHLHSLPASPTLPPLHSDDQPQIVEIDQLDQPIPTPLTTNPASTPTDLMDID